MYLYKVPRIFRGPEKTWNVSHGVDKFLSCFTSRGIYMPDTHTWHPHHVLWVLIKLVELVTLWDACTHHNLLWKKSLFSFASWLYPFMNTIEQGCILLCCNVHRGWYSGGERGSVLSKVSRTSMADDHRMAAGAMLVCLGMAFGVWIYWKWCLLQVHVMFVDHLMCPRKFALHELSAATKNFRFYKLLESSGRF